MALPRYEVLSRTFIEPFLLDKGSVIEYAGSPGPHLFPLNEEARAAFETWYNEEHVQLDKEGEPIILTMENGNQVEKKWKPHLQYRRAEAKPAQPKPRFNLISGKPKPQVEDLDHTLGGLGLKQATPDVRPGPDRVVKAETPPAQLELFSDEVYGQPAPQEVVEDLLYSAPVEEEEAPMVPAPAEELLGKVTLAKPIPKRDLAATLREEGRRAADKANEAVKAAEKEV